MNRIFRVLHRDQAGFTLLEILVVVAILGILIAVVVPNILMLMNEGEEEVKITEHRNIQVAVLSMMVKAGVTQLDGDHEDVDEVDEVQAVTVTDPDTSTTYRLYDFLTGGKYPLMQAYDISLDGYVSVD